MSVTNKFSILFIPMIIFVFYWGDAQTIKIGTATKIITPDIESWVQGVGVSYKATKIKENLEANALYISNNSVELLMVSCVLGNMESYFSHELREAMGVVCGVLPRNIMTSCTHTHSGPSIHKSNYLMPLNTDYMERLKVWLVDLAKEPVVALPGKMGWAKDEVQIGHNCRLTCAEGIHIMGGDAKRSHITGLEGPDDPQHLAMFFKDLDDNLLAIEHHNTTCWV